MNEWIAAHVRHMRARALSENTIEDRVEVLGRLDRELPMGLIRATVEELQDWLARPGWSTQTKATYHGHICGFFREATNPQREPHLSYDPSASLPRPIVPKTTPRPVTSSELALVLDKAEGRWRVYCLLAAYAGLRACEIAIIRREDINEDNITIKGKGGKTCAIPTHPAIWGAVRSFPIGPIARKVNGPADAKYVSHQTSKYLNRRLGPAGALISLHRLRHWYGTHLLRAGANLRVVQELMRHSSPATTAIYTQVSNEERAIAVSALPVLTPTSS